MPHSTPSPTTPLLGVDFTSAPTRRKPITVARGQRRGQVLLLEDLLAFDTLAGFGDFLARPGRWIGGFDFPFGLPRELVLALGWPQDWPALIAHYTSLDRATIRATFAAFCAARPAGAKFAHRACDAPAGSSPSMKWVNPPVAFMLHAGVPLLLAAGADLPGHNWRPRADEIRRPPPEGSKSARGGPAPTCAGDPGRVALEAYPGLLARELIGRRSYKSDDKAKQSDERLIARKDLIEALEQGRSRRLGLRLKLSHAQRDGLAADASGDRLDAVLCLMQAAWAEQQPAHGLPPHADPLEGWIVSAEHLAPPP
ncbi:DUF429 domain-containing protein [Roseateles violae]|uniref:DUF429 domain-containing protein n=1 Tax=Roseateles violae TaxID=3058042 RepID=A0ABT8DR50_9BURK|nr:DUF429 domain-containing protein [Pelomonas sp. PFR6]MDN3920815.1 DUF429 domain-containing protein [Pelomonas sp. PFR6]